MSSKYRQRLFHLWPSFLCIVISIWSVPSLAKVRVGSKIFTESYILAEIISQKIENSGLEVERQFGLGATGISFQAVESNQIDLYVEYTGTISQAVLKHEKARNWQEISSILEPKGLWISKSLGFNNTYAIAVKKSFAQKHGLKTINDLKKISEQIRMACSYEFMRRKDGYDALLNHYGLQLGRRAKAMEHSLAYQALSNGQANVVEVYSTDAKIKKFDLVILKDNLNFFPKYEPVVVVNKKLFSKYPQVRELLQSLEGTITEQTMVELNAMADLDRVSFSNIAYFYFNGSLSDNSHAYRELMSNLARRTYEHLWLVFIAVFLSVFFGIPLGVLSTRNRWCERLVLSVSGILQTIPSLALLCFLIPFFGIGAPPAIVALFLYGLLPVVINTFSGIQSIEGTYIDSATALGLSRWQILTKIELPLASQSIWAGVTTSTIISIGTATIAALIGAGGYGAAIVTGLALNDTSIILKGAIPAAVMALAFQWALKMLGFVVIPKGLR